MKIKNMNRGIMYGVGGLVAGTVITLCITSYSGYDRRGSAWSMMGAANNFAVKTTNTPSMMAGTIDEHFIEQMIPHHEDAISMATIALQKANHQEIITLSQNIKKSQGTEIAKMQNWYQSWYGKAVPQDENERSGGGGMMGRMQGGMMGNDSDERDLENAANFDKAFIEQMIPHHQMAVMMANMLLRSTTRPEMKQLASDIITAQTAEINQMRTWYQQWGYTQ
jgi:uncharacterized protein (DUF305 family)